jgi:hypothetical protein
VESGRFDPGLARSVRIAVPALVIWVVYEFWRLLYR